jgi:pyridinium-3,5-bisthiocarboxylic acid mononucleotide nickel chelatase
MLFVMTTHGGCYRHIKREEDIFMNILYYDCFSGISGDMHLGAMIDLGVDRHYLANELKKLPVNGYELSVHQDQRRGISGTRVDVIITEEDHQAHLHHAAGHAHQGEQHQHQRSYRDIVTLITNSSLNDNIKKIGKRIFLLLAQAEGTIHNTSIEEVHFHEVGAVDSIVDIVGAAICIDCLNPDKIIASPLELGSGFVDCAHGIFPVPAPATLEILKNKPVKVGAIPFEATTPTGAAILAAVVGEFVDTFSFVPQKTAYGIGHRDHTIPNVLRVCLCSSADMVSCDKQEIHCDRHSA